jgi:single-strand DNA-binding protein
MEEVIMNKCILIGRLVKDPDVRYSQGQEPMAIARYTLAVDRAIKKDREQTADFISCVAFGKNGEFAEKYLHKGTKIAIEGRIQTGSYEKDGRKVYTTDIVVEHHEFCESRNASGTSGNSAPDADGFVNVPDSVDDEALPFN